MIFLPQAIQKQTRMIDASNAPITFPQSISSLIAISFNLPGRSAKSINCFRANLAADLPCQPIAEVRVCGFYGELS
jgi:hypothetical protein